MSAAQQPPSSPAADDQAAVLEFLSRPESYAPPPADVVRIDTHSAAVFLAGATAYKIKRAVRYPFLDFSTLEKRRLACLNELAVNRRTAGQLYQGVVPITRESSGALAIAGAGEPVEWAVKMARFEQSALYDQMAREGRLEIDHMAPLADTILAFHAGAPRIIEREESVAAFARLLSENEAAMRDNPAIFEPQRAERLIAASRCCFERLQPLLRERAMMGYVRHCHGDLHLRNIVEIDGRPVLFDAIEFDDAIATVDVLYDLAFLLMDLLFRGLSAHANALFNRYLGAARVADLRGLAALPFYLSTRALIRSKAEVLRAAASDDAGAKAEATAAARAYFDLAASLIAPAPPRLIAVGGLSGSGKSTLARALAPCIAPPPGAVHLRSDAERKRLFGVPEHERLPPAAYAATVTETVYHALRRKAAVIARAGHSAVVDAVHGRADERAAMEKVARDHGVAFTGLWLEAGADVLLDRVAQRRGDASDATTAVVREQLERDVGPLTWRRLRADGPLDTTLSACLDALGIKTR